jgi:hypothetical protein
MRLGRGWSSGRGLTKYIVLSVVAHLSLLIYALSFRVLEPGDIGPGRSGRDEPGLKLQLASRCPNRFRRQVRICRGCLSRMQRRRRLPVAASRCRPGKRRGRWNRSGCNGSRPS